MIGKRHGFTLIELLVSIILTTLLIALMLVSYQYLMQSFKKHRSILPEQAIAYYQLRSIVEAMAFYAYWDYDAYGSAVGKPHIFFDGTAKRVRLITHAALFSETMAIVELSCSDKGVIYKEQTLYDAGTDFIVPQLDAVHHSHRMIATALNCSFGFYKNNRRLSTLREEAPERITLKYDDGRSDIELDMRVRSNFHANTKMLYDMQNPL